MTSVPDIISAFFEPYRPSRYAKGQVFLLEGENVEYIYYLIEGRVKIYTVSYRGDDIILYVHQPYDFFPAPHILSHAVNNYIYEADTETVVRRAPIEAVRQLVETHPAVAVTLLRRSYTDISALMERQSLLMAGSAKRRLIYELVIQCRYFTSEPDHGSYVLTIHEKDLAARTGLSRETINREVRNLKRENLITLVHRQIVIPRIEHLEAKLKQSV